MIKSQSGTEVGNSSPHVSVDKKNVKQNKTHFFAIR